MRERTHSYEHCSETLLEQFGWEIDDPSVARVEYSAPVVAITGLAVGQTTLRLVHDLETRILVPPDAVEP